MVDAENPIAIYDPQRNAYVVANPSQKDSAGIVEYRFTLEEPTDQEPRYVGYIEKSWIEAGNGKASQAFVIGRYVYKESFNDEVKDIIQQAREVAIADNRDEFTCVIWITKSYILDNETWDDDEPWWSEYFIDPEKILFSVDGLWTLGPEDRYSAKWRA